MQTHRVLLFCIQPLLSEGLQRIFQSFEDVELTSLEVSDLNQFEGKLSEFAPEMVVLAGEKEDDNATHLISKMLKIYEDIPIIWIELETNLLRLYTSHSLSANSSALIQAIHANDATRMEIRPLKKKLSPNS